MNASVLVETLRKRGITLRVIGGRLEVRPASALTPEDRDCIRANLADIIAALTPPAVLPEPIRALAGNKPWDQRAALRLMADADALFERLGVNGRQPAVADAAATVTSAFAIRDMETLCFAVAEFVVLVRTLAPRQFWHEERNCSRQRQRFRGQDVWDSCTV